MELAHYEWVELALALAEGEAPGQGLALEENPLDCVIALSEVAWPLAYRFPVQHLSRDVQPTEPPSEPTLLAVYRDCEDTVHFVELNPPTYRLLKILEAQGAMTGNACLRQIAQELGSTDPTLILAHGADMLRDLAKRGVIGAG